jgi:hypothetical protein
MNVFEIYYDIKQTTFSEGGGETKVPHLSEPTTRLKELIVLGHWNAPIQRGDP